MTVLRFLNVKARRVLTHMVVALAMVCGMLSSAVLAEGSGTASLIVKLVEGLSASQQALVIARNGGVEASSIPALRLHTITVQSADLPLIQGSFAADPQVMSVELNKSRKAEGIPGDPHYGVQWALAKIGWDQAFGLVSPGGSARIALLDTGVDATHPDLAGAVIPGTSILESGSNGLSDPNGHGTSLAGILAAVTGNDLGIAGIGYQGVSILPVTVLNADGTGQDSDIIQGIIWAADHGADVILMPFSNPDFSQNLQDAINYAWSKGAVLVSATGNNGVSTATFPAGAQSVIGVSATTQVDLLDAGSNYGLDTFLAAPGTNIFTTSLGGGYTDITGTSASSAIVAGVAAFMKAVDPALTNGIIVGRLARSADAIGPVDDPNNVLFFGNGRVNMASALAETGTDPVQPSGAAPVGTGGPYVGPYTLAAKTLSIVFTGAGSGSISFSQTSPVIHNGFSCNDDCAKKLNSATLTVAAGPESTFAGWSGAIPGGGGTACTDAASPCRVEVKTDGTLFARFKANQTIAIVTDQDAPAAMTYDGTFTVSATGGASGNPIDFATVPGSVCSIVSTTPTSATVRMGSGVGTCQLTMDQAGNDDYNAATQMTSAATTAVKKELTGSFTAASKIYDGTTAASVETRSLTGVLDGDTVALEVGSASFDSKVVGVGKTVTVTGLALSGADAAKYTVNATATAQADITAKHITGAFTAADKVYDGTVSATVLTRSLNGVIAGDNVSLDGGVAAFADNGVGAGKTVTLTGATLGGTDAGNYVLDSVASATASITAAVTDPDLIVAAITGPAAATIGSNIVLNSTVQNIGGGVAGASTVRLYLTRNNVDYYLGDRPAASLAAAATDAASSTVPVPAIATGDYKLKACADHFNLVIEASEENNCTIGNSIAISSTTADLVIAAITVPAAAVTGQMITVPVATKNQGLGITYGNVYVDLYLSSDSTITRSDTRVAGTWVTSVAAGQTNNQSFSFVVPALAPGTYYIGAITDKDNLVAEYDETNNTSNASPIAITIGADLLVTAVTVPATAVTGQMITVPVATKNQGLGTTYGNVYVDLYLSTDSAITKSDTRVAGTWVTSVAAGQTNNQSFSFVVPALAPGTYYIGAITDKDNLVAEYDETNNTSNASPIAITIGADLLITAVTVPTAAVTGQMITVPVATKNQGLGTTYGNVYVDLYLSTDSTITRSDTRVAGTWVTSVAAGQTNNQSFSFVVPALAPGTYYIGAITDKDNLVAEYDETNNTSNASPIAITIGADLLVTAVTVPAAAVTGQMITVPVATKNQGLGTTYGNVYVDLYLSTDSAITKSDTRVAGTWVTSVAAGQTNNQSFSFVVPALAPGTYYIGAITDKDNLVAEYDETNNTSNASPIAITIGADLLVTAVTVPATAVTGQMITVPVATKNQGLGTTYGNVYVDLYLSTDSAITKSDTRVAGTWVTSVAAGQTNNQSFSFVVPALAPGTYYIGAITDKDNLVPEYDESNNTSITSVLTIQ